MASRVYISRVNCGLTFKVAAPPHYDCQVEWELVESADIGQRANRVLRRTYGSTLLTESENEEMSVLLMHIADRLAGEVAVGLWVG